jgi:hypothetical protein
MSELTKAEFLKNVSYLKTETKSLDVNYSSRSHHDAFRFFLYPISQLNKFQHWILTTTNDDKRIAKFVVTKDKTLLIAQDGKASHLIPHHGDMAKHGALAAGFIFFNLNGEVIGVSNESDDFKDQSLQRMIWPLIILLTKGVPLAPLITVINHDPIMQLHITKNDLDQMITYLSEDLRASIENANNISDVIIHEKLPPRPCHLDNIFNPTLFIKNINARSNIENNESIACKQEIECF